MVYQDGLFSGEINLYIFLMAIFAYMQINTYPCMRPKDVHLKEFKSKHIRIYK